jgi:hypothetical protein
MDNSILISFLNSIKKESLIIECIQEWVRCTQIPFVIKEVDTILSKIGPDPIKVGVVKLVHILGGGEVDEYIGLLKHFHHDSYKLEFLVHGIKNRLITRSYDTNETARIVEDIITKMKTPVSRVDFIKAFDDAQPIYSIKGVASILDKIGEDTSKLSALRYLWENTTDDDSRDIILNKFPNSIRNDARVVMGMEREIKKITFNFSDNFANSIVRSGASKLSPVNMITQGDVNKENEYYQVEREVKNECTICNERGWRAMLVPCNHGSFCARCAFRVQSSKKPCPICQGEVKGATIYFV